MCSMRAKEEKKIKCDLVIYACHVAFNESAWTSWVAYAKHKKTDHFLI